MDANGLLADEQALTDLAVRPASGDLDEDLAFASAQTERVATGRWLDRSAELPRVCLVEAIAPTGIIAATTGAGAMTPIRSRGRSSGPVRLHRPRGHG